MDQIKTSPTIAEFAKALSMAQAEMKNPTKDHTADAMKYKYKYADLADVYDACKGPLTKNGIVFVVFNSGEFWLAIRCEIR